ncbi:hypothetical protein [Candidatus Electrothrix sp.]|uniref:hypothetical protein n=1 Tax=Candidatus Electrothrix sp. TaxID=2170559 RepID=UPI0040571C5D
MHLPVYLFFSGTCRDDYPCLQTAIHGGNLSGSCYDKERDKERTAASIKRIKKGRKSHAIASARTATADQRTGIPGR